MDARFRKSGTGGVLHAARFERAHINLTTPQGSPGQPHAEAALALAGWRLFGSAALAPTLKLHSWSVGPGRHSVQCPLIHGVMLHNFQLFAQQRKVGPVREVGPLAENP